MGIIYDQEMNCCPHKQPRGANNCIEATDHLRIDMTANKVTDFSFGNIESTNCTAP